jgi:hypothetical protein
MGQAVRGRNSPFHAAPKAINKKNLIDPKLIEGTSHGRHSEGWT